MNAHIRPQPMRAAQRVTFTAWRVLPNGNSQPLDIGTAETYEQAIAACAPQCQHKDVFHVLRTDAVTHEQRLAIYTVKAKPAWRKCPDTLIVKQFRDLYAAEVSQFDVVQFAPVEPWTWTPGADVVGIDRTILHPRMHSEEAH